MLCSADFFNFILVLVAAVNVRLFCRCKMQIELLECPEYLHAIGLHTARYLWLATCMQSRGCKHTMQTTYMYCTHTHRMPESGMIDNMT